jgi:GH24 family phage-related lysozyme (muramidase)
MTPSLEVLNLSRDFGPWPVTLTSKLVEDQALEAWMAVLPDLTQVLKQGQVDAIASLARDVMYNGVSTWGTLRQRLIVPLNQGYMQIAAAAFTGFSTYQGHMQSRIYAKRLAEQALFRS